jgi:hypothetical protein
MNVALMDGMVGKKLDVTVAKTGCVRCADEGER